MKWPRFTHEMSHCLQSAGKNHQTKTRARSIRLCLEENKEKKKKHLDPPYVSPKLQHFTVNMYYIFVFNFSQIQHAQNCSTQSVYVFCSNRMMRKFALYKRTCCCKLMVEEFSHLVCYKEMPSQNGRQISE